LSTYSSAISSFVTFCDINNVDPKDHFPASKITLCWFASSFAGLASASSVCNKISTLKAWHTVHNTGWLGGPRLDAMLGGISNLSPPSSSRPKREPVHTHMLSVLHAGLDHSNSLNVAVWAAAATAFWGQCRLGELLAPSISGCDLSVLPSHTSVNLGASPAQIFLPWTKVTKRKGALIHLPTQYGPSNPASALKVHMRINRAHPDLPLFHYMVGSLTKPLTKPAFMARCNAIWSKAGLARLSGHAFRIGGTTELLLASVHPDVVKVMGCWSSDAFLRYWRSVSDIVAKHACFLHPDAHKHLVAATHVRARRH
ncbi:hypothetical protein BOTBODRAFT_113579, partial [Botryobasidium botryosum FD-172 SS1]